MARAPKIEARQKIEARLWQDPFAAIAKYAHKAKNARNGDLTATEADPDDSGKCAPFKDQLDADAEVLGVMLPGGPYAELSEVRRRTRYAVLSGLERRDYIGKHKATSDAGPPRIPKVVLLRTFRARFRSSGSDKKAMRTIAFLSYGSTKISLDGH
jgi:hypothetical protein